MGSVSPDTVTHFLLEKHEIIFYFPSALHIVEQCKEKWILPMCDLPRFRELLKCYRLPIKKWGEKHFGALYIIDPIALSKQTTLIYREPEMTKPTKMEFRHFEKILN